MRGNLHDENDDDDEKDERGGETTSVTWCIDLCVKVGSDDLALLVDGLSIGVCTLHFQQIDR